MLGLKLVCFNKEPLKITLVLQAVQFETQGMTNSEIQHDGDALMRGFFT